MVERLTLPQREAINNAEKLASEKSGVVIKSDIRPISSDYHEYVLLYGFFTAVLCTLLIWGLHIITEYPHLLMIQCAIMFLIIVIAPLRNFCLKFVPRIAQDKFARQRAIANYSIYRQDVAEKKPFVLLFISINERYVQIIASPEIKKADNWDDIIALFIHTKNQIDLTNACLKSIEAIGDKLSITYKTPT